MIEDLAIITNTHSSNQDVWEAHVGQIKKYMPDQPHYFFTDVTPPEELGVKALLYNKEDKFRTQFLDCIQKVKEPFVLYLNEDYILYDEPKVDFLEAYTQVLKDNGRLSYIRLGKGVDEFFQPFGNTLFYLDCRNPYFFSQTAALWNKTHLEVIHDKGPDLHIAGNNMADMFEPNATEVCRRLGIVGAYHFAGEPKRGMYHYDSIVFPYIATALIKGKWCSEYKEELEKIIDEYGIDEEAREWS